jgi:hypothetical protein
VRGDGAREGGRDELYTILLMTSSLTILLQRDVTIDLSEDGFIHTRSEAWILRRVIAYVCKAVRKGNTSRGQSKTL